LTDEDLDAASPIKYLKGEDEIIGTMLTTFLFHESYHVGQTGLLRRIAGNEGAIR
ncbi:MAG: DinB family protein, partial [bacterium]|nr:DinB family protein [bacterium]